MNIKKYLLILILAILASAFLFISSSADVCGTYNIGGWAWSSNIGWISLSCENTDELEIDYGINMSVPSGVISSGEIWSSNIGWISFDPQKTGTPPAAPDYSNSGYLAKVSSSTYELSGWARALAASSSQSGGWDGWIKFGWETPWLSDWSQRIKITIDHNDIDSSLSNFPILVHLSSSAGRNGEDVTQIFDEVGSNNKRIAITESDGTTQCYVEIEEWDIGNEEAWLWVKVPAISSSTDTDLYLYYDNLQSDNTTYVGDTNSTPAENVWDEHFMAVYHMSDGVDTSHIYDSTGNDNDSVKVGVNEPLEIASNIGKAQQFDGINDYARAPHSTDFEFGGVFTVEAIFQATGYTDVWPGIVAHSENDTNEWSVNLRDFTVPRIYAVGAYTGCGTALVIEPYGLNYYAWAASGSTWRLNLNGADTEVTQCVVGDSSQWLYLGRKRNRGDLTWRHLQGTIDEVRISDTDRSTAWIKATKETIFDDLLDFESGPATGTVTFNNISKEFEGYAWGGDDATSTSVVGWLSFNGSNYQATTTTNFGPTISSASDSYSCPCEQSRIPTLSWETDESGDYIYQVQITASNDELFSSPIIDATSSFYGTSGSWSPVCSYCCLNYSSISWDTPYIWRVKIKVDGEEIWSSWKEDSDGFTTPIHCYPYTYFLCSYDQESWYDCDGNVDDGKCAATKDPEHPTSTSHCIGPLPHPPSEGQQFYIGDSSTCYEPNNTSFSAQDCSTYPENDVTCPLDPPETTTYYQWSLENITSNSGSDFATSMVTIEDEVSWTISATTTDTHSPDQECGHEEGGDVGLPLPEWKEIAPF